MPSQDIQLKHTTKWVGHIHGVVQLSSQCIRTLFSHPRINHTLIGSHSRFSQYLLLPRQPLTYFIYRGFLIGHCTHMKTHTLCQANLKGWSHLTFHWQCVKVLISPFPTGTVFLVDVLFPKWLWLGLSLILWHWASFHMLTGSLHIFGEMLIQVFCQIFNWVVFLGLFYHI